MADCYDIFISYRRDGGFATANHLNSLLKQDGYTVSFDVETFREGDFDVALLERIKECTDFILIVDKHCFDRTLGTNSAPKSDWLRQELAFALEQNKNIIPILLPGAKSFPHNLPPDIKAVTTKNGPEYNQSYFSEFYDKLKSFLHSNPHKSNQTSKKKHVGYIVSLGLLAIFALLLVLLFIQNSNLNKNQKTGSMEAFVKDSICVNTVMGQYEYTGPVDEDGLPNGKGLAKFPQGDTYDGEFSHGEFEGKCTYINAETGDRFVGTYKENMRYEGTYVWKEGPYFSGFFKNNELYKGVLYDVNGEIIDEY